jgi:hypothetical protein
MTVRTTVAVLAGLAVFAAPTLASAQSGSAPTPMVTAPHKEVAQFAFLFGQWDVVATAGATSLVSRIHGMPKMVGTWKVSPAFDGFGVEDDLRLADKSGNPLLFSHSVRIFDPASHRWKTTALDVYRAIFTSGTAEWHDGDMIVTSNGVDPEGQPYVARSKYFDITRDRFHFQQDRSVDGGKSWTVGILKLDAKRSVAVAPR